MPERVAGIAAMRRWSGVEERGGEVARKAVMQLKWRRKQAVGKKGKRTLSLHY